MAFYNCGRLGNKTLLSAVNRISYVLGSANYAQASASIPKITYKKFEQSQEDNFEIRNTKLKRPLSPHLSIYSPQLTSILSITHRASGMLLSGYAGVLGIGALALPNDISHYLTMIEGLHLSPATLFIAKALIAAPFAYHFVNGVRHLYWDTAKGLTIKEVYATGYTMLAVSLIATLILAAL